MIDISAFILKMIFTLSIIYAVCIVITSPFGSKKAKGAIRFLLFIPLGLISVISLAQSLAASNGNSAAAVALCSGIAIILLYVCVSTDFGRGVLANVVGNTVYDLLKSAFKVLVGVPSALKNLFK